MRVIRLKKQLSTLTSSYKKEGKTIGFVPTMGALHNGHLSLIHAANAQCDLVVVSIFVNPTQFDNPEDLEKYPRTIETDLVLLEQTFPEVIVFNPTASEVYGSSVITQKFDFGNLALPMEGKHRIGHFDGVATVLQLLFEIVRPQKAFFGEKDFQQLLIARKMVAITGQPVEIIACPIEREPNGLARSSRNERLSTSQRTEATFIYRILQQAKAYFGTKSATFITNWAQDQFAKNPHLELEYFEIANAETLQPLEEKTKNVPYRAFIAAYAGKVRLIDNIALN